MTMRNPQAAAAAAVTATMSLFRMTVHIQRYGHLASAAVSVGDYVSQGKVIGYAGCTGFSTGNHLHFEVRVNGSAVDPMG